jgi:hypothetical protein
MIFWYVLALVLEGASPAPTLIFQDQKFGQRQTMTCNWVTNFETSRFGKCRDQFGKPINRGKDATVVCSGATCKQLDDAARAVSGWQKDEPPWGNFEVTFSGRLGLTPHRKRYLGDANRDILVEDIQNVSILK